MTVQNKQGMKKIIILSEEKEFTVSEILQQCNKKFNLKKKASKIETKQGKLVEGNTIYFHIIINLYFFRSFVFLSSLV